jgi:hypothetical protein
VTSAMPMSPGPASPGPGSPSPGGHPRLGRLPITPGRRAAILIGVPIVFLILATGGFAAVGGAAAASFPVAESVPIPGGKLTMNLGGGGSATLRGSDVNSATARVSGIVTYHLTRPSLQVGAGDISLNCPKVNAGNCGLNATVDVPPGIALNVQTGGGNLTASDLSGGATLNTDGGDLTLTNVAGQSDLALASSGGNVHLSQVSSQAVTISADGGDITGSAVTAAALTASSGGGDVTLTLAGAPRDLQVNADGGNVTIVVPQGSYIVTASADGGTVSAPSSTPGARNVISVSSGGGDISISESS